MPGKLDGPAVTVRMSCYGCLHETSERYACQGDSGFDVYCNHASYPERRHISISASTTPKWCPCLPLDELTALRARVAELEGDLELAAGELLVDIPAPGTDMARMLAANSIMRREIAGDNEEIATLRARVAELSDAELMLLEEVARLRGLLGESLSCVNCKLNENCPGFIFCPFMRKEEK